MADRTHEIGEMERLFARNTLSRRQLIEGLAALGVTAGGIELLLGSEPRQAEAQVARAQYFVLIVLDAFRPDYATLAPMPNLLRLVQTGTTYERAWVGQLESETPTGHATLSTGAMPRHDNVPGFEWRDPRSGREILDGWDRGPLIGALERDMRAAPVDSIPRAIKAADPRAKVVALSSEKIYAADAMSAAAADYVLYHRRGVRSLIPSALPGHVPPPDFFAHPHLQAQIPITRFTNWDYLSTELALAAMDHIRPKALMINLPGADVYGHPYGGPATPAVMREVVIGIDRDIGRIVSAYKRAGIYDQTLFVVTSDHGMVPNTRRVDSVAVRAAVSRAGGQYLFHTGGTAAYIYLRQDRPAPAVAAEVARLPNVVAAYHQVLNRGHFQYELASGVRIDQGRDRTFRFLLSTFAGPTAPQVVAVFRENTITSTYANAHGDHGGLSWGVQSVPLVLSGPGVARGLVSSFPARLMDVAPTVLRLLGVPARRMDGIVLADALIAPAAAEVVRQSKLYPTLSAYQNILVGQSLQNMAEDQSAGLRPPPSLPARP